MNMITHWILFYLMVYLFLTWRSVTPFSRIICLYFLKLLFAVPQLNLVLPLTDVIINPSAAAYFSAVFSQNCVIPESLSDDTEALNAWFRDTCQTAIDIAAPLTLLGPFTCWRVQIT